MERYQFIVSDFNVKELLQLTSTCHYFPIPNDLNKTYTCSEKQNPGLAATSASLFYSMVIKQ